MFSGRLIPFFILEKENKYKDLGGNTKVVQYRRLEISDRTLTKPLMKFMFNCYSL